MKKKKSKNQITPKPPTDLWCAGCGKKIEHPCYYVNLYDRDSPDGVWVHYSGEYGGDCAEKWLNGKNHS